MARRRLQEQYEKLKQASLDSSYLSVRKQFAPLLNKKFAEATAISQKLRLLWTMHAAYDAGDVIWDAINADGSGNEYLRAWAIQLHLESGSAHGTIGKKLVELASTDPSPVVRLYLASGLQRLELAERWEIALGDVAPEEPRLPPGIQLCAYRRDDADLLRAALNEAFAIDPFFHEATPANFREFYLHSRGFDPSLWLLAWDNTELAGFILAFPEHTGDTTLGWVESLGVRPPWRGGGLGESLLRAAFCELHARGLRAIALGVDGSNETGAVRLYERVGMTIERQADNWALDL